MADPIVKKSERIRNKRSKLQEVEPVEVVGAEEIIDVLIDDDDAKVVESPSQQNAMRMKVHMPEKGSAEKSRSKSEKNVTTGSKKREKKKDGKGGEDTDSEEERWLDAIESGKLDDVDDELKRIKNPKLMTIRQRALLEKRVDTGEEFLVIPAEPLLSLPSGFKEKVVTEEMLAKKAVKTQRRRQQAQEKREVDKKKTVDRLLKKQDSKLTRFARSRAGQNQLPMLTYLNNQEGSCVSIPVGFPFPMTTQTQRPPPQRVNCGVKGCTNGKKYSCSRTGIPLCSLGCYHTNLAANNLFLHDELDEKKCKCSVMYKRVLDN